MKLPHLAYFALERACPAGIKYQQMSGDRINFCTSRHQKSPRFTGYSYLLSLAHLLSRRTKFLSLMRKRTSDQFESVISYSSLLYSSFLEEMVITSGKMCSAVLGH